MNADKAKRKGNVMGTATLLDEATAREIVRRFAERAVTENGPIGEQKRDLIRRIKARHDVLEALTEAMLENLADTAVYRCRSHRTAAVKQNRCTRTAAAMRAVNHGPVADALMDALVDPDGTALGDMDGDRAMASGDRDVARGKGHLAVGWLKIALGKRAKKKG
ncbi:unnamed protein product, partial [marine sediment metagenome]